MHMEQTHSILSDSDRNILRSLRHESCEAHCDECGQCDNRQVGPDRWVDVELTVVDGVTYCDDCVPIG